LWDHFQVTLRNFSFIFKANVILFQQRHFARPLQYQDAVDFVSKRKKKGKSADEVAKGKTLMDKEKKAKLRRIIETHHCVTTML
jgi:hypothetical protein